MTEIISHGKASGCKASPIIFFIKNDWAVLPGRRSTLKRQGADFFGQTGVFFELLILILNFFQN